ncbi:branched-chain amino acid ABC transporter, ATP-binding protein (plasmid) [Ruegeria pomeroyi DSS-3]|uniref:Branched-chain amino acid ABC transporter, ATP-binding protein n=2 Tax=Ruegeria pomeroyi TaxID=89184 RepID=Q5LLC9_RUEPO|nr:ABC transporter ATP-binding protein [Ruegeria pomeroyi]AAV97236.1 branched-chain amino acid ABC transporter, ATP-binding protein [Ruegeria pomeroyi DSS-3]NVK98120.1 ABC transporter ATP-binding protein [Ruegeria pomeroyi]NVL02697.1 ABC transporter ATP-binding protein [Ruegeria pomeroyi]HCE71158.1 ABC transporter ATP-binding protein [Ruegeria sp.]
MSMLEIENLDARYGDFQALFGISLNVRRGETIALVGANGAGKTTLLRAIAGLGQYHAGVLRLNGRDIGSASPQELARMGISMVPEGRRLFTGMSVAENLMIGADLGRGGHWVRDAVFDLFPEIAVMAHRPAGLLSGGQQQMVSLGRALMTNPDLLLVDEVSLGLAPVVVDRVYAALAQLKERKTTLVVVEQDIRRALDVSDRFYCMLSGRVALAGASAPAAFDAVSRAYFGEAA